jgi:sugar lactone lactonase YvrE
MNRLINQKSKEKDFKIKTFLSISLVLTNLLFTGCGSAIEVFAGNGKAGLVESLGINAQFNQPYGLAIDKLGNLFVADSGNNRIRKISPGGIVSTFVGGDSGYSDGNGTEAKFSIPGDLVLDQENNLFVIDAGNFRIRKVTPNGNVTTFAGNGIKASDQDFISQNVDGLGTLAKFYIPRDIAIDKKNNIYVLDSQYLRKITPNGQVTTFKEKGQNEIFSFYNPIAISVDNDDNVYVVHNFGSSTGYPLLKINIDNSIQEIRLDKEVRFIKDFVFDDKENLYIASENGKIFKLNKNFEVSYLAQFPISKTENKLFIDNKKNILFISNPMDNRIYKIQF